MTARVIARNVPPGEWGSGVVTVGPDHPLVIGVWEYGPGAVCARCEKRFQAGDVVTIEVDALVQHANYCKMSQAVREFRQRWGLPVDDRQEGER